MSDKKYWLAFGGSLAVIAIFIVFLMVPNPVTKTIFSPQGEKIIFPQEIMGMKLANLISGEQAKQSVSGLHGLDIQLKEAYIATYQDEKGSSAIIWISESNNLAEAKQLFDVMDEKMPNNTFFTNYERKDYKGLDVRYVYWPKMNMHDFYYLIDNKNYWVAVTTDKDQNLFLDEVLQKF